MIWSPQQDSALVAVRDWLANPERGQQVFYLAGFAGTGKTTLAQHFASGVEGRVLFGAFTGKAANVLRQKGCPDATTIHSLIYIPRERSRARLLEHEQALMVRSEAVRAEGREPTDDPEVQRLLEAIRAEHEILRQPAFSLDPGSPVGGATLLVVDEVSMIDARMGEDLLSFGTPILVLGDPAQLPPVHGAGYFTERTPDVMLTEIHRQAQDNPIIALATQVREQRGLAVGSYGSSRVVERGSLAPEEVLQYHQLLVGRNKTRRITNRRVRELLSLSETWHPTKGDKLVCLRNDHELGLLNGSLWNVEDVGEIGAERLVMTLTSRDYAESGGLTVEAHSQTFRDPPVQIPLWALREAAEFDYGYALTVHKAQGSQWDDVLVFDESWAFRADRWKWLYTGITRAAQRVTVMKMD